MKNIFLGLLITLPLFSVAQSTSFHIDSCGFNNHSELNTHEVHFFNKLFSDSMNFDFQDKRVAFLNANDSITTVDKQLYFLDYGKAYYYDNNQINHSVIVLTNEERARIGFDVVVITLPQASYKKHNRNDLLYQLEH